MLKGLLSHESRSHHTDSRHFPTFYLLLLRGGRFLATNNWPLSFTDKTGVSLHWHVASRQIECGQGVFLLLPKYYSSIWYPLGFMQIPLAKGTRLLTRFTTHFLCLLCGVQVVYASDWLATNPEGSQEHICMCMLKCMWTYAHCDTVLEVRKHSWVPDFTFQASLRQVLLFSTLTG